MCFFLICVAVRKQKGFHFMWPKLRNKQKVFMTLPLAFLALRNAWSKLQPAFGNGTVSENYIHVISVVRWTSEWTLRITKKIYCGVWDVIVLCFIYFPLLGLKLWWMQNYHFLSTTKFTHSYIYWYDIKSVVLPSIHSKLLSRVVFTNISKDDIWELLIQLQCNVV